MRERKTIDLRNKQINIDTQFVEETLIKIRDEFNKQLCRRTPGNERTCTEIEIIKSFVIDYFQRLNFLSNNIKVFCEMLEHEAYGRSRYEHFYTYKESKNNSSTDIKEEESLI